MLWTSCFQKGYNHFAPVCLEACLSGETSHMRSGEGLRPMARLEGVQCECPFAQLASRDLTGPRAPARASGGILSPRARGQYFPLVSLLLDEDVLRLHPSAAGAFLAQVLMSSVGLPVMCVI